MSRQYPYTLQVLQKPTVIKDDNGDFVEVEDVWETHCNCRDEKARDFKINSVDGGGYAYTVVIYAPKGTKELQPGTSVRVLNEGLLKSEGKVILSRKEYFHTRIWL